MANTFTILDNGETLITGEWVPAYGFDDIEAKLIGLSKSLDNLAPVLLEARELARQSTEAHFDSESDPSGTPWAPLSIDWRTDKRKTQSAHPDEILQLTGAGKETAISEDAYFIAEGEIWFNPNVMPDYMAYHQRGTVHAGAQAAIEAAGIGEITSSQAQDIGEHYGRGKALPKREFIGFDEIDIIALEEAFNSWFAANVEEFFPEGGILRTPTGFNVLGEFPIIGYTKRGQPLLKTSAGVRFGRKM